MLDFDVKKLIRSVKKRPALYSKHDSMYYSTRKHRNMVWREVCKEVIPNWEQMRPPEKVENLHDLQRRWKSLRTCFSRELQSQRQEQERLNLGLTVKRRKKYAHFNLMNFLLNNYSEVAEADDKSDVDSDAASEENDDSNSEVKLENEEYSESSNPQLENIGTVMIETEPTKKDYRDYNYIADGPQDGPMNSSRDVKNEFVDEDKQFLLSLVPSFRKLDDKQKFEARIGILNVLKDISFKD